MADRDAPSQDGGVDWRRLASDRNVSHAVARALWDHARATAPDDPMQAERAFHGMLEEAEAANATHEPGRETLVDAPPGARDASSLGPGKWTRTLLEEQKPRGPAGSARRGAEHAAAQGPVERGTETGKPSAEALRSKLVAAEQASKHAAALLAASDPATILEALRELRDRDGPAALHKIMSVAGGAIERILDQRAPDPATQAAPAAERAPASRPAAAATRAPVAARGTPDPTTANRAPTASKPAGNK